MLGQGDSVSNPYIHILHGFPYWNWVAGLQALPVTCTTHPAEELTCRVTHCRGRSTFFPATAQANPGSYEHRQQSEFCIPRAVFVSVCARQGWDVTPAADLHRLPMPHVNEVPLGVRHWATMLMTACTCS